MVVGRKWVMKRWVEGMPSKDDFEIVSEELGRQGPHSIDLSLVILLILSKKIGSMVLYEYPRSMSLLKNLFVMVKKSSGRVFWM